MAAEPPRQKTTETKLSFPFNGTIYTTTDTVAAEKTILAIGTSAGTELGSAWNDSLVIDCNVIPSENKREMRITHARIPGESAQLKTNWSFATCSIGGRQFPSVQRTVILLANSSFQPPGSGMDIFAYATPAIGSSMPVEGGSPFAGAGYILADRQVVNSGMQLEPVFIVERRNYIIRTTRRSIGVDPLNGKALYATTSLYYTGETPSGASTTVEGLFAAPTNAYWGLQTDGTKRTGQQLSCSWYSITIENVIAGTFTSGELAIDSYDDTTNFYWPPVLNDFELMDWNRKDGGTDTYPRIEFEHDGYSGPCNSVVTRTWRKTPWTGFNVEKLLPTPGNYSCPYFALSIPSCLHPSLDFVCDTGTNDPVYKQNVGSLRTIPASQLSSTTGGLTDCTSWPTSLRVLDSQQPFRGGFLRTTRIVYAPNT